MKKIIFLLIITISQVMAFAASDLIDAEFKYDKHGTPYLHSNGKNHRISNYKVHVEVPFKHAVYKFRIESWSQNGSTHYLKRKFFTNKPYRYVDVNTYKVDVDRYVAKRQYCDMHEKFHRNGTEHYKCNYSKNFDERNGYWTERYKICSKNPERILSQKEKQKRYEKQKRLDKQEYYQSKW